MRILFSAALVILLSACAAQQRTNKKLTAQIVIERPENNGSVNIVPCIVGLNSGQRFVLNGDETNSFLVESGTYFLTASSVSPYETYSKSSDWKSNRLKIAIADSQVVKITLEPKSKDSTYIGGWSLSVR